MKPRNVSSWTTGMIRIIGAACLMGAGWVAAARAGSDSVFPAFKPENPPGMERILSHRTPAYRAAKYFKHGANLGDYLEANRYHRYVQVTPADLVAMHRQGFDHVRVPVGWHQYAGPGPDYTLEPEIFSLADFVVTNALQNHLAVIINIHHFNALDKNPAEATPEFLAIWRQVARHYRDYPAKLAFELDNEPHDQATSEVMNGIDAEAIAAIRESNPGRTLFVEPGNWGGIPELKHLALPPDDNVIVSVHCYDPFFFTHQGASWTGGSTPVTGIRFPGPPDEPLRPDPGLNLSRGWMEWLKAYNTLPAGENPCGPKAFVSKLKYARAWSDYYGRPVHLGEFGAYTKADAASRARFYKAFRRAAEAEGMGWCIWDWNAGFRYWDSAQHRPEPGMHAALFGGNWLNFRSWFGSN